MNSQPTEVMYIESKTYTRTMKSQILSTISIVREGVTRSHVVTDHFVITELVTAHKIMPSILRASQESEPSTQLSRILEPTPVPSSNTITLTTYEGDTVINPVEFLVGLDMEPTALSLESDTISSQSSFSTPPLPLPPPHHSCIFG